MGRNRTAQRINNIHEVSQQRPHNPRKAVPCSFAWKGYDKRRKGIGTYCIISGGDFKHRCIREQHNGYHRCRCLEVFPAKPGGLLTKKKSKLTTSQYTHLLKLIRKVCDEHPQWLSFQTAEKLVQAEIAYRERSK